MPNILFFASEVSVICKLNPYRKVHDTFLDVWKRTDPTQLFRAAKESKCEVKSREEKLETLIKAIDVDGKISELVKSASCAKTIEEVKESIDQMKSIVPRFPVIEDSIQEMISDIDAFEIGNDVFKTIESQMNRGFGTQQEAAAISEYEKKESTHVASRNDRFHKRTVASVDGCSILVGGKVDGIREDGTVVEVKNRMRRFFDPLPRYDIAQLQTYLFILDSPKGELVEQLKGSKTDIRNTPIDRDLGMWESVIQPSIVRFGMAIRHFMQDTDLQRKFVEGNECEREHLVDEILASCEGKSD